MFRKNKRVKVVNSVKPVAVSEPVTEGFVNTTKTDQVELEVVKPVLDEEAVFTKYESGAFSVAQVAEAFDADPTVVREIVERLSVEKHGEQ